jgi:hypothetical protein
MSEARSDKQTVRGLWIEAVAEASAADSGEQTPLYLTLAGALGLDIEQLIDEGLVRRAENRAIAAEDEWKVVAVEANGSARLQLKERFTGLRILSDNLTAMLHSTGPFTWPQGEKAKYCRARVVNLDFNSSLRVDPDERGRFVLPTVQIIGKLAELHLKPPALDWMLCLTVAAHIGWPADACAQVQAFLRENFQAEEQFAADSREVLGEPLFERLLASESVDLTALSSSQQQAVLMVFVPKKIVAETYHRGWKVTTTRNLRYGGQARSGRMVTWLIQFTQDARAEAEPRALYSESLNLTLAKTGTVAPDGQLQRV